MAFEVTDNTIREIKHALISRDRDQLIWIIDKMKELMNDKEVVLWFINANIPEDLCDSIKFLDIMTTRCIYSCLEEMMQFEEFFAHNHASYAIDSLIKGIFMLIKNNSNDIIVKEALSLLIVILHGYSKHDVAPPKADVENSIQLLQEIFTDGIPSEMKIQIGFLVDKILNSKSLRLNDNSKEILSSTIIKWFSCSEQIRANLSLDEFVILTCSLSEKILRSMKIFKEWSEDIHTEESNSSKEINSAIYNFLMEVAVPYFEDVLLHSTVSGKILESFFQAIFHAFEEMPEEKSNIAQKVSCKGFLQYLTNVLTFARSSEETNLQKLCLDLLTKILLTLSEDVFQLKTMWPGGLENFQRELIRGVSLLPPNSSAWLDFLIDVNAPNSSKLALIIYLYFYFLSTKNFKAIGNIYPFVVNFVNFSTEIISQPLFVKAVWFVFAMSQMMKTRVPAPEEIDLATELIIRLIEGQKSIDFIYTHHPATLYWSISSSKISPKIRQEIIECWIENTTPDCRIIRDFLRKHPEARSDLISILENREGPIVESVFFILKSVVIAAENDDVTRQLWFMIPSVLSKYLADPAKIPNADYMIELASLKTPEKPDLAKAARTAGCLSEIIVESNLISLLHCFRLAFQLLESSEKLEDHRVAQVYLRTKGFLKKIYDEITLKSSEMAVLGLKIITILWKLSRESEDVLMPSDVSKVRLNFKNLQNILAKGDITIVPSILELFAELFTSEFKSDFFLVKPPSLNNFRNLYHFLQSAIIKEPPGTKILAWKCLKLCLTMKTKNAERIVKNLIFDPWTHEMIRFSLQKPHDSPEMKSFFTAWIGLNTPFQDFPLSGKQIGDTFFAQTVKLISAAITDAKLTPDKLLCKKILQSHVDLSAEIREKLDEMTRD